MALDTEAFQGIHVAFVSNYKAPYYSNNQDSDASVMPIIRQQM